ncbi:hypothetical protein Tco_1106217 [Tanacetum coccineum]
MANITAIKCALTQEHLDSICAKYFIPEEVHPQLPSPEHTMHDRPSGKVGMYTRFFDYANYRIPFTNFFVSVLVHFRIPFSQLSVFGSAKVSQFEILYRVCNIQPHAGLFHYFYMHNYKNGWFRFAKRPNVRACYSKNLDSVKNWNDHFFWVDEFVVVMDLNAFIQTADPYKVRVVERPRAKNKSPIVTVAKHRTVTLLPTSVDHPSEELSESIERKFSDDGGNSGSQEGAFVGGHGDVAPVVPGMENVVVETEFPGPKRSRKKRVVCESDGAPYTTLPAKRLRADYGKPSGSATVGKSPSALNSFTGTIGPRTIVPSARFIVLSDSSHHSGTHSAGPEVDSSVRSTIPLMTEATVVTTLVPATTIPAAADKDKDVPSTSVFGSSSSSEKTDCTLSLFSRKSGSDFVVGSIHAEGDTNIGLEDVYVPEWSVTKGFELNDGSKCANMIDHFTPPVFFKTVRGMEHEQLFAEFNWRSVAEEKDNLLTAKDKEIEELKSQLIKSKDESAELEAYEGGMKQLEEFQDSLMKPLEARVAELDADFTKCCISFQENFHPHLLNVIAGRRWLLTHGMRLLVAKCLKSSDYMEALGFALSHAIEKGMQDGLAASIEHGQAGRCLTDLEAYIPSAEDDFNFAVCDVHGLDFPLVRQLFEKTLEMADLQPDVNQLMVPVHDKQKRVVIGSQALSMAMDVFRGRPLSAIPEEPAESLAATNALSTIVIVPLPDPSLSVEDNENPDSAGVALGGDVPKTEGEEGAGIDTEAADAFLDLENEARDAIL